MFETRDLVWKAMYEADVHRRYYEAAYARLLHQNRIFLWVTWSVSAAAAFVSVLGGHPLVAGCLVLGAAFSTTLRDLLRIPERTSMVRCIRTAAAIEFNRMSLLWDSDGNHQTRPERESRLVLSQFQTSDIDAVDEQLLASSVANAVKHLEGLGAASE